MKTVGIAVLGMLVSLSLQAATLAGWENDCLEGEEASVKASRVSPGLKTEPVLERGSGLRSASYMNTFGGRNVDKTSLEEAVSQDCFFTWTLEAAEGSFINLSDVMLRLSAQNAGPYVVNFALFSDQTGFAAGNELTVYSVGGTGDADDALGKSFSTDLNSIPELQGVQSVEFRLYIWGQDNQYAQVGIGNCYQTDGLPDLTLSGTVAPVPADAPSM